MDLFDDNGRSDLESFEVSGFRAIGYCALPELARVNLFVGQNNAGKTSLLEAVRLYVYRNSRSLAAVVHEIVGDHSDFRPSILSRHSRGVDAIDVQAAIEAVETLFYGSFDEQLIEPISLRPLSSRGLVIRPPWSSANAADQPDSRPVLVDPKEAVLELASEATTTRIPLDWFTQRIPVARVGRRSPAIAIPASGFDAFRTRQMWDNIVVAGQEPTVEDAVRSVIPKLERILVVGESRSRTVLCKLKGFARPVPIKAMGDGTNRVFGLAVALIQARGGALLIDEVENGLHHTVHHEVWGAIFSLAQSLDVQVFATTHSWEAVVAFQHAANRSPADGMLYRLEPEADGKIYAERYTERDVAIAAEQHVEVR